MPIIISKAKSKPVKREPVICQGCKHTYMEPCHGQNENCPNLIWLKERRTQS